MNQNAAATLTRASSIALFLLALVLFGAAFPATGEPARFLIDLLDWPLDGDPASLDRYSRWMCAISSGLTAAFAALSFLVVAPALQRGDRRTARAALIAIGVWFVMDSAGSLAAEIPLNALFNLAFLILYAAPLILLHVSPAEKG